MLLRAASAASVAPEPWLATPRDDIWLALRRGSQALVGCSAADGSPPWHATATAVRVQVQSQPCCQAVRCRAERTVAALVLTLEGGPVGELELSEVVAHAAAEAVAQLAPLACALGSQLGLELGWPDGPPSSDLAEPPSGGGHPGATGWSLADLAPWSLGTEGDRFVLREHAVSRPTSALVAVLVAVATLAGAGASSFAAVHAGAVDEQVIMTSVALALALTAAGAMAVVRQAGRFVGSSAALLVIGLDRLLVRPWLSDAGAVDAVLSGHFGAAVPLKELGPLEVVAGRGRWALHWSSEHGPFEIGGAPGERLARAWRARLVALAAVLAHERPPRRGEQPQRRDGAAVAPLGLAQLGLVPLAMVLLALVLGAGTCCPPPAMTVVSDVGPVASGLRAGPRIGPVAAPATARVALLAASSPAPIRRPGVPIVEDDLPAARRLARAGGKLLLVEVWARWCHTCLSMKSFVLTDPALLPLGGRVVFAAIDSDRPESEPFVERHAVDVWPTIYLLDPSDDTVLGMRQGAASVKELVGFIRSGLDVHDATGDERGPLSSLIAAKRAHTKGRFFEAGRRYQQALRRGGDRWPRRSEAVYGWIVSELRQRHPGRCAQLGVQHLPQIEGTALPTDLSWVLLECAEAVRDPSLARRVRDVVLARLRRQIEQPPQGASVDDRADALGLYASVLQMHGQLVAAQRALRQQLDLLERAAAAAPSAEIAATFDYPRMKSYLALGRGGEAVTMLRARTLQLPDAYEPWARLAEVLVALRRPIEARPAAERAVALSYGPRKLRYLRTLADIAHALGDASAERHALEQLVAGHEQLVAAVKRSRSQQAMVHQARARLRALGHRGR